MIGMTLGGGEPPWWILGGEEPIGAILGGVEPRPYVEYFNT